jgi:phage terminase small subunit
MTTHDQEPQDPANAESGGIHPEPAPFEPGYQPGSLPEITVPDLAEDAVGVSAEVLAEAAIPTLTEQVEPAIEQEAEAVEETALETQTEPEAEDPPQEPEAQADTWHEQMQVRMSKLTGEIQTLNDRLDRLEQRAKNKG